jgi:hypothetical protein
MDPDQLKRRDFITLLSGAAAAWPLAARAQQARMPVIGFLSSLSVPVSSKRISSFGQGLSETDYIVGRDVTVEARMAEGQYDRLPALAADLVAGQIRLIAKSGPLAKFAAKAATTSNPVVFVAAFDPVQAGLVASLNRPGGNVTGITLVGASLGGKRLELARELVPNVRAYQSEQPRRIGRIARRAKCRKGYRAGTARGASHERSRLRNGLRLHRPAPHRGAVDQHGSIPVTKYRPAHCPSRSGSYPGCL